MAEAEAELSQYVVDLDGSMVWIEIPKEVWLPMA